jgi:hypothetical protein
MNKKFKESDSLSSSSLFSFSFSRLVTEKRRKLRIDKMIPKRRGNKPGPGPYRSQIE